MSILSYAPKGYTLRKNQVDILIQVEDMWNKSDVIVIPAPVASGKSVIILTIAKWMKSFGKKSAILTPRVSLQTQYSKAFPSIPVLKGADRYTCGASKVGCRTTKDMQGHYCEGCKYKAAKTKVSESSIGIYNMSSYLFAGYRRDILLVDEAHNLYSFISDQFTLNLWKHIHKYPKDMKTCGTVAIWLEGEIKSLVSQLGVAKDTGDQKEYEALTKQLNTYRRVLSGLQVAPANFFIEKTKESYRGKMKDVLKVRPTVLSGLPEILWPSKKTEKVILLSGTISDLDMRLLGLRGKRVSTVTTTNPIPAQNRPIDVSVGVNMSYKYQDKNMPKMADLLEELRQNNSKKGLIHTTYAISNKLKKYLTDDRYIFHTKLNKDEKLAEFIKSEDKIFVACGMSEGLDLAGSDYTWQAITKIQYPNKADQLIDKWYREDSERVNWMTIRTLRQQIGRICRTPEDFGITYVLDTAFGNLVTKRFGLVTKNREMFTYDVLESVKWT